MSRGLRFAGEVVVAAVLLGLGFLALLQLTAAVEAVRLADADVAPPAGTCVLTAMGAFTERTQNYELVCATPIPDSVTVYPLRTP